MCPPLNQLFEGEGMIKRNYQKYLITFVFLFTVGFFGWKTDASAAKAYFSVEKFTIGQGYLVEPVEIDIKVGEQLSAVTERVLTQAGYTYNVRSSSFGWYLVGINNADSGNSKVPTCISGMSEDAPRTEDILPASEKNEDYPDLNEYSYTSYSGWMFYPNNQDMHVGAGGYPVQDGDVIRLRFTLYGIGADLDNGRSGSLSLPNLDAITKRMAVYNANKKACDAKGYASAYSTAKSIVTNMDSTVQQVEEAYDMLPSEEDMRQWGAELAQKEKEEAEKKAASTVEAKINSIGSVTLSTESSITAARKAYDALSADAKKLVSSAVLSKLTSAENKLAALKKAEALKKKYTPGKAKIIKIKAGKKKIKLTWKKIKSATGYQVWMSKKKSSEYKKIVTIKKANVITYTRKKLKSKKNMYFRVRAYRKVGKVIYYGAYSSVKKAKVK